MNSLGANAAPGGDTLARGADLTSSQPLPARCRLTPEEREVWRLIPLGRANAIKQKRLAMQLLISTRTLQRVLKNLTEHHGLPIASACSNPMGVFIPETEAEVREFIGQLRSRALSCFTRIKALNTAAARAFAAEIQGSLPLDGRRSPATPVNACTQEPGDESRKCECGCGRYFKPARPWQRFFDPDCQARFWSGIREMASEASR